MKYKVGDRIIVKSSKFQNLTGTIITKFHRDDWWGIDLGQILPGTHTCDKNLNMNTGYYFLPDEMVIDEAFQIKNILNKYED